MFKRFFWVCFLAVLLTWIVTGYASAQATAGPCKGVALNSSVLQCTSNYNANPATALSTAYNLISSQTGGTVFIDSAVTESGFSVPAYVNLVPWKHTGATGTLSTTASGAIGHLGSPVDTSSTGSRWRWNGTSVTLTPSGMAGAARPEWWSTDKIQHCIDTGTCFMVTGTISGSSAVFVPEGGFLRGTGTIDFTGNSGRAVNLEGNYGILKDFSITTASDGLWIQPINTSTTCWNVIHGITMTGGGNTDGGRGVYFRNGGSTISATSFYNKMDTLRFNAFQYGFVAEPGDTNAGQGDLYGQNILTALTFPANFGSAGSIGVNLSGSSTDCADTQQCRKGEDGTAYPCFYGGIVTNIVWSSSLGEAAACVVSGHNKYSSTSAATFELARGNLDDTHPEEARYSVVKTAAGGSIISIDGLYDPNHIWECIGDICSFLP